MKYLAVVISFVTTKGKLCGLDLRMQELAWDLKNDPKYGTYIVIDKPFNFLENSSGLMLFMALDPFQNWVALGTSLGYHVLNLGSEIQSAYSSLAA